ncbi:MAG: hypothetical protein Athens041674_356 [Parcubacteria group bacterium Athens0416_74]|nr:MAG: hypothetical protein Athens041674_356 [Parcubacteria group bacterium Athens0416_74]
MLGLKRGESALQDVLGRIASGEMTLFDHFTGLEKPGVVLIDMQPDFVSGLREYVTARVVHMQKLVLAECARLDIPAVALEYRRHGATIPELAAALERVPRRNLIVKTNDDGFHGTDLKSVLTRFDVRSPVLMGINAHACVLQTADSGLRHGFAVKTSEDIIADQGSSGIYYSAKRWYEVNGCLLKAPG